MNRNEKPFEADTRRPKEKKKAKPERSQGKKREPSPSSLPSPQEQASGPQPTSPIRGRHKPRLRRTRAKPTAVAPSPNLGDDITLPKGSRHDLTRDYAGSGEVMFNDLFFYAAPTNLSAMSAPERLSMRRKSWWWVWDWDEPFGSVLETQDGPFEKDELASSQEVGEETDGREEIDQAGDDNGDGEWVPEE